MQVNPISSLVAMQNYVKLAGPLFVTFVMVWLVSSHNAIAFETPNAVDSMTAPSGLENPTYIITRQQIELSGRRTFGDLFGETIFSGTTYLDGRLTLYSVSSIPLVAIERIEVWIGSPSVSLNNQATGGTVNIVLRDQFHAGTVQLSAERPTTKGADTDQLNIFWGGELENGTIFMAAEHFKREQIQYSDRDFLKSKWTPGGKFADTRGVSLGGNTAFANNTARAVGSCDPEVYTGILNEPGGTVGATGCGFPWANIAWLTDKSQRNSYLVNTRSSLDDDRIFTLNARVSDGSNFGRSAPAVDEFDVTLPANVATSIGLPRDVSLFHRFVANGNREDSEDFREFEFSIALQSQIANNLNWNTDLNFNSYSESEIGNNYILKDAAQDAIADTTYDVVNPFETPESVLKNIEVQLTRELDWTNTIFRNEFNWSGLKLGGRDVDWTAGFEIAKVELQNIFDQHRQDDNVIGSFLNGIDGQQRRQSLFTELKMKPDERWYLSLGLRGDRYSDVGTTTRHRIASEYYASEDISFRASWMAGSNSPSLNSLYSHTISHPSIVDPARIINDECEGCFYQVKVEYLGNPNLEPVKVENFALGISGKIGSLIVDADLVRSKTSNTPVNSAQAIVDIEDELGAGQLPEGADITREGTRIVEMTVPYLNAGNSKSDALYLRAQHDWQSESWNNQIIFDWTRGLGSESTTFGSDTSSDSPRDQLGFTWLGSKGNLSVKWSTLFVSGFDNYSETHRYDEWFTHNVGFELNKVGGYDDLTVKFGVLNIENRGPPTDPTDTITAGLTDYHSWLGRTYFVSAEYNF